MLMFRLTILCGALAMALWPLCVTQAQIYAFAFFYAFCGGGFISISPVIAGDLWGVHRLGGVFVLVNIVQIPGGLSASPLAGLAYQQTGSYNAAIWPAAFLLFLAGGRLFMVVKSPTDDTQTSSRSAPCSLETSQSSKTAELLVGPEEGDTNPMFAPDSSVRRSNSSATNHPGDSVKKASLPPPSEMP
jgi:MFS family permease